MRNKTIFEEFAVLVLKELCDSFPIPIKLDNAKHLEEVIDYPEQPFVSHFGIPGNGVYVGPDFEWVFDDTQRNELWGKYDWNRCINDTEALINRALTDKERTALLEQGVRPYSDLETELISEWRKKIEKFNEDSAQLKNKESIYTGTIQFLVHEGYVRIMDLPEFVDKKIQPPDVLIERALERLKFSLTNKGYVHLNRTAPLSKSSVYDGMKAYVADKSVDALMGAGAGSLLSLFLGG